MEFILFILCTLLIQFPPFVNDIKSWVIPMFNNVIIVFLLGLLTGWSWITVAFVALMVIFLIITYHVKKGSSNRENIK